MQEYRELSDGSAVKITVSEWLTPNERSIDEGGITPDEVVEFDVEKFLEDLTDTQLEAALEYFKR